MKKLIKNTVFFLFFGTALLFNSCSNIISNGESESQVTASADGKTYVRIGKVSSNNENAKTILPNTDITKFTNLVLSAFKMTDSGDSEPEKTVIATAGSISELSGKSFELSAGNWEFNLSATLNDVPFSGIASAELAQGTTCSLSFVLACNEVKGGFSVTVNFSESAALAIGTILGSDDKPIEDEKELSITSSSSGKSVTFERYYDSYDDPNRIDEGTYTVVIEFYGDTEKKLPLSTYKETMRIANGCVSKATRSINLAKIFTITYNDNGGELAAGETRAEVYSRKSEEIELPKMQKAGYIFVGWYGTAEFTDGPIEIIPKGATGHATLHARYINTLYVSSNGSSDASGFSSDSALPNVTAAISKIKDFSGENVNLTILVDGEISEPQEICEINTKNAKSITLKGANELVDNVPQDVLNGNSKGTTLTITTEVPITIENLKITGGYSSQDGGGIRIDDGSLTLKGYTKVTGNTASDTYSGGGIFVTNASLRMEGHSSVDNNSCNGWGGGILVRDGETSLELCGNASVTANTGKDGGGISCMDAGGGATISDSVVISGNTSLTDGGGLRVWGCEAVMSGGTISGNTSTSNGGGVSVNMNATFIMTGGVIGGTSDADKNTDSSNMSNGVYVNYDSENPSVFKMGNDALVTSNNDVYLSNGSVITISNSLTGGRIAATIRPSVYSVGTPVLSVEGGINLEYEYDAFAVTPQSDIIPWSITEEGKLFDYFYSSVINLPSGTDGTAGTSASYVYFGAYPQSEKEYDVTIDETKNLVMGELTYYLGSDNNLYANYSSKYYKVEPIKWRVLDTNYNSTGKRLLFAENCMTQMWYHCDLGGEASSGSNRTIDVSDVYATNYKYSLIRAFLNGLTYYKKESATASQTTENEYENSGFLQTAFTSSAQDLIQDTIVDNSASSVQSGSESYICANTTDKIFLLSYKEVGEYFTEESSRIYSRTSYAEEYIPTGNVYGGNANSWWLRSPTETYYRAQNVSGSGSFSTGNAYERHGVVPALCVSN